MDARKVFLPKISSDFKLIYDSASEDNRAALDGLLQARVSVDVRDHRGLFTPAQIILAKLVK